MEYIKELIFAILIYCLYWILRITSWLPSFKDRIKEKNFTMVLKIQNGKRVRYITFNNGSISSRKRAYSNPDISLIWDTATNGIINMIGMSIGYKKAFINSVITGKIKLKGDAALFTWFIMLWNQIAKSYHIFP